MAVTVVESFKYDSMYSLSAGTNQKWPLKGAMAISGGSTV